MELTCIEVAHLIEFVKEGNADYLQFRPILPRYFKEEKLELNEFLWQYLADESTKYDFINLSNDKLDDMLKGEDMFPYDSCEGHHFCCVLDSNGDVTTCMYHPRDNRFVFGNINEMDFNNIWYGDKRQEVIKFIREELDMCKECQVCCKLNEINKLLQFVKQPPHDMDVNFL